MTNKEYIETGILELYVFGNLSDAEMVEVQKKIEEHPELKDEVLAIEEAIIHFSKSVSPRLSAKNYEKIRNQIIQKRTEKVIKPSFTSRSYLGWAAAAILVIGFGFQYNQLKQSDQIIDTLGTEKVSLQETIIDLELKKNEAETILAILRDSNNQAVILDGQAIAPNAYAKAYYNKLTKEVYIDIAGLPEPPKGKVYQVWALKLTPLTPMSIGVLENSLVSASKVIKVENATDAEAFGITLEPEGGSITPTLEQLYVLGKV